MKSLTLVLIYSNLIVTYMKNKTKKALLITLVIVSMLSFGAIQMIDCHLTQKTTTELQDLGPTQEQIKIKFDFCMTILESISDVINRY